MPQQKDDQKRDDMKTMKRPMKGVTKSSSSLESIHIMMGNYTIGQEVTFNVANGKTITLPELNEEQITAVQSEQYIEYMRNAIHHPTWFGWPDATGDYKTIGFVLQALNHNTARVLLIVNDPSALEMLAMQYCAYVYWGYILHIDKATVLRPDLRQAKDEQSEIEDVDSEIKQRQVKDDVFGMEVA